MHPLVVSLRSLSVPFAPVPLRAVAVAFALACTVGCSGPDAGAAKAGAGKDGAEGKGDQAKDDGQRAEAGGVKANEEIGSSDATAAALPEAPLTEEEKRLLAADPATLTQEERKQLPYLRRKKIMQNPDSDAAKSIQRSAAAYAAGEMPPPAIEGDAAAE